MSLRVISVVGFLLAVSPVWAAKPIMNMIDEPVPVTLDGSPRDIDEVKTAIINGCRRKGWTPVLDGEDQVKCSINVRVHYAEVLIPFSAKSFSIIYSDSRELDYNPKKERIHRNYNRWVANLAATIRQEFDR